MRYRNFCTFCFALILITSAATMQATNEAAEISQNKTIPDTAFGGVGDIQTHETNEHLKCNEKADNSAPSEDSLLTRTFYSPEALLASKARIQAEDGYSLEFEEISGYQLVKLISRLSGINFIYTDVDLSFTTSFSF